MKKRLNKKGFTLVELLATVVILLSISTVAITSISASIDRQNAKKDEATKEILIGYGTLYLEEHINDSFTSTAGQPCVSISTLKTVYSLDEKTLLKTDGTPFTGSIRLDSATKQYTYYENAC